MKLFDVIKHNRRHYLGYTKITYNYHRQDGEEITTIGNIYFYSSVCGKRRIIKVDPKRDAFGKKFMEHDFIKSQVHAWLEGDEFFNPIQVPSVWLKTSLKKVGWEFIDGNWVKSINYEKNGNVISIKSNNT